MTDRYARHVRTTRQILTLLAYGGVVLAASGCVTSAPAPMRLRTLQYDIHVSLQPATHELTGVAALTLSRDEPATPPADTLEVALGLQRDLAITRVSGTNARVSDWGTRTTAAKEGELASVHHVTLGEVANEFTLLIEYHGTLVQDVQAGERPGQIHNFEMNAHIGTKGVYLAGGGCWYPTLQTSTAGGNVDELARYRLTVEPVSGMELVAGAEFDKEESAKTGDLTWVSKYPLDGLTLVGGPHVIKRRNAGGVSLALHYAQPSAGPPDQAMERNAELFLDAAAKYVQRYQPLIGPFPFDEFTIVENFFSSGFAFPHFTLLSPRLLQMGPRALMHGYLDHEMLHAYWGNSIYVDPTDGNWCEALTSYAANHYGYILDGDAAGARKYRRNACNAFTQLKPDEDLPLDTFGDEDGAGRTIGYNKGAVVFHMLARRVGQENFWAALRRLTDGYTGKYASWQTFQRLFETQSGADLTRFFQQWVRQGGAPFLTLEQAQWDEESHTLSITVDQGRPAFDLRVPLRLLYELGPPRDIIAAVDQPVTTVQVVVDAPPTSVELDPDYDVFRRLRPGEMLPTARLTTAGTKLLVVTASEQLSPFYETVISRFSGRGDSKDVTRRTVDQLTPSDLESGAILILGDAVRDPAVSALLRRTDCPVTWFDGGFRIEGEAYDDAEQSVLCTVHHPDVAGGGITVYTGNSETALGRSDLLLFYGNSLLVFETTAQPAAPEPGYHSQVVLRRDFETPTAIDVMK